MAEHAANLHPRAQSTVSGTLPRAKGLLPEYLQASLVPGPRPRRAHAAGLPQRG
jgi:hypothetical protein